jgi:voltage-gated potassium channel
MSGSGIAIFGCGALGFEVAGQLQERYWTPLLVDNNESCLATAVTKGIETANIDYTDDEELRSIGIGTSIEIIFCLFEEDAKNVFLTISARALSPDVKILSLTQSPDSGQKLRAAGATKVIDPYEISGRKVIDLLKRPLIAEAMEGIVYGEQYLNMAELDVTPDCFLSGERLSDLDLSRRYNLVLLGVVDRELGDEFIFTTTGVDHKLDEGDVLVVIGPTEEIEKLRQDMAEGEY